MNNKKSISFFKWLKQFDIHLELPLHLILIKDLNLKEKYKTLILGLLQKDNELMSLYNSLDKEKQKQLLSYIYIKYEYYQKFQTKQNYLDILNYLTKINQVSKTEKKFIYNMYTHQVLKDINVI